MIQDIAPHRFINHFDPEAAISPEDPIFIVKGNQLLCRILSEEEKAQDPAAFLPQEQIHDGTGEKAAGRNPSVMEFPRWALVTRWLEEAGEVVRDDLVTYLFTIDREEYFLLNECSDALLQVISSGGTLPASKGAISGSEDAFPASESVLPVSKDALPGRNDTIPASESAVPASSASPNGGRNDGVSGGSGYQFYSLADLREKDIGPKVREFAAMTGIHLAHWYANNRFCGRCGHTTVRDTRERALRCPHCGNVIYPRIVPAVIVGVLNPRTGQILVTKYRVGYSHYALVAGFTEIGETLEGTVRREVMEETGLSVKNIRYYKSQPWGIVDDILAGFYCDVDGDDTIRMDTGELKVAEWVSPADIELQPQDFSLTNEMMQRFRNGEITSATDQLV